MKELFAALLGSYGCRSPQIDNHGSVPIFTLEPTLIIMLKLKT